MKFLGFFDIVIGLDGIYGLLFFFIRVFIFGFFDKMKIIGVVW